ncbi:MAG TPA: hypothetical protein VF715_02320 [Thermoleophilaceae bacterium]
MAGAWRRLFVTVIGSLACAALAGSAGAASVRVFEEGQNKGPPLRYASYQAAPGEVNDVTVTRSAERVVFSDPGATIEPGSGCSRLDDHSAACTPVGARVFAGDMDDRVAGAGLARGGAGDDLVTGSGTLFGDEGDDELRGGAFGDSLDGGPGYDRMFGGAGDDQFADPSPYDAARAHAEPDLMDGGPGLDHISYWRHAPTGIDLSARRGGDEGDELVSVEGGFLLRGGALLGDSRANRLHSTGPSVFIGGGGADTLDAASNERDVLDGGSGDDSLRLAGVVFGLPRRDRLRCGPGRDELADPAPNTLVPVDCERAHFSEYGSPDVELPGLRPRGSLAAIRWTGSCDDESVDRCEVSARVHAARWGDRSRPATPGTPLGSVRGAVTERRPLLHVVPNAAGRRLLASGRCLVARVVTRFRGRQGPGGEHEVLFRVGGGCRAPAPVPPAAGP